MNIFVRSLAAVLMALALVLFCILIPFIIAADMLGLKRFANKLGIDWETKE